MKGKKKRKKRRKKKACVCVPFLLLQRPIFILILKNKFHQSPFFSFLQPAKYKFSHLCLLSLFFSFTFSAVFFIQDLPHMAEPPTSPAGGSHESGGEQSPNTGGVREQDRYLPIANISRIMKKALPANGKIAKDAKDTVQECVSEFISFITSEASDKCQKEKRKTINGDDLLWAMATLGFEDYIDPLKSYLTRYRELECDAKGSSRGGDESSKRDAVGALPVQNSQQYMQTGALTYMTQGGQHLIIPSMQNNE